ncbi:MAG: MFS transporter [Bacteroidales bacterium]
MMTERQGKLFALLSLYMVQAIPMSFFSTVVPVIMRQQHYSLEAIGLMQLIKLPWIIKFLWAPLVDRTGSSTKGYRRWIFYSEGFYAFSVAVVAFFRLDQQFTVIIILMVLAITASATQDIATDAWAILTLKKEERSLGNSMQSMGSFLGAMAGSGALLVVYHYLGWQWLLLALSGVVLLALLPLMFFRPAAVIRKRPRSKSVSFRDIGSFFLQPHILPQLLLLALFHSALIGIMTMIKPLMIDTGYSVKDIGLISGLFGTAAGAGAAMAAGLLMRRISRKRSALAFALFNLVPALFFTLFHAQMANLGIVLTGVALLWSAYAMGMVFVFTIAMDQVRHCREGTDFTMQIVIVHLASLILAVASGKIAGGFSYHTLFVISIALGVINLLAVRYRFAVMDRASATQNTS